VKKNYAFNLYFQAKYDTCVWYGECEKSGDLPLNCRYNGSALPITNSNSLAVLQEWCPDFIQDYSEGSFCFGRNLFNKLFYNY